MKTLVIKRIYTGEAGTFGVLIDDIPFAVTLEDPWKNNMPFHSCIPDGTYICQRKHSPKFGETFEVLDVDNRDHILFHRGNTKEDTEGCILVGESFEGNGIAHSGKGFDEFMERLKDVQMFILIIEWK